MLGAPITHSLSPVLHTAAYAALGLRGWSYGRVECDERGLAGFVAGLGPSWVGLSLTMPLKRVALTVADEVSPLAAAVGAANTLVLRPVDGQLRSTAHNTDVAGIVAALREAGVRTAYRAVVLGAGGTAQAALAALRELGVMTPVVVVRDPARTSELRDAADRLGLSPVLLGGYPAITLPPADVIISTLPRGAADDLAGQVLASRTVVLDAVYAPWPTRFAASAMADGCQVVSGLSMLLHQAVAQVRLMTGRPGPVEPMREALHAAVRARV